MESLIRNIKYANFCVHLQNRSTREELLNTHSGFYFNDNDSLHGVEGYVISLPDKNYIVFHGTNHKKDWWINFNILSAKLPYPETMNQRSRIRVSKGWIEAYKQPSIRNIIHTWYKNQSKNKCTIVTGWSMGAAIATYCALDLQYHYPDRDLKFIGLGSPKTGNKAFKNSFEKRIPLAYNFINGDDLVTKVPFSFLFLVTGVIYRKIGNIIHIGEESQWFRRWTGRFSKDHDLQKYKENIEEAEEIIKNGEVWHGHYNY